jgi:hypothetical protein
MAIKYTICLVVEDFQQTVLFDSECDDATELNSEAALILKKILEQPLPDKYKSGEPPDSE